ncbi:hypothetical protein H0G86_012247 [Trichoderma simmonsii]|uniref:Uncharacterized protein n=1 Tax=Trichoderma simmonsii TaxID=1491479 RepID=A0A8G0LN48_9HYPO|nr:hypothetical protein H0G86_012247 [Trichoderma simmonsii]
MHSNLCAWFFKASIGYCRYFIRGILICPDHQCSYGITTASRGGYIQRTLSTLSPNRLEAMACPPSVPPTISKQQYTPPAPSSPLQIMGPVTRPSPPYRVVQTPLLVLSGLRSAKEPDLSVLKPSQMPWTKPATLRYLGFWDRHGLPEQTLHTRQPNWDGINYCTGG